MWTSPTLPNGSEYGPIILLEAYTLQVGQSIDRDRIQYVLFNAPFGNYTYNGYVVIYPDTIWDEDHFSFEKLPGE